MPVNFFIAGVQKGGTTALDQFLRAHPQIQMAAVKEVHYFDDDSIDWKAPDYSRLKSFFDWSTLGHVRGEATPIYLYWPNSLRRLQRYNRAAKLVIGLRHPSFRAFSHWRMEVARGLETLPFDEAIGLQARARVSLAPGGVHRVFSYVERGLYSAQIAGMLNLFPRHQIFFYRTDELWQDHDRVVREVQSFLNVESDVVHSRRYITPVDSGAPGALSPAGRARLDEIFAADICITASLTGLDLADWLDPSFEELIREGD